ncbi:charged multivesicular body protein 6-like isoform X1 [Huso huso]|uniref:Charged multivesicular body protein 6-like isoform X1 n=1 Tax=Huso huso TaxID=61971 RepID=A0ABR0Z4G3_HUSHU
MGNIFGRKRLTRVTEQDRAVLQLKQQRDKLKQYQKRINLHLEKERLLARQLLRDGKKPKALLLLKKKRYQEQLLDKTENQISNLERMVQDIEFAQIEMKVIEGLKIGNDCLKKMHEVMSIEDVERIMEETQDGIDYQRQIDEVLAGSLTREDEDAVLAELEALTQVWRRGGGGRRAPGGPHGAPPQGPRHRARKGEGQNQASTGAVGSFITSLLLYPSSHRPSVSLHFCQSLLHPPSSSLFLGIARFYSRFVLFLRTEVLHYQYFLIYDYDFPPFRT